MGIPYTYGDVLFIQLFIILSGSKYTFNDFWPIPCGVWCIMLLLPIQLELLSLPWCHTNMPSSRGQLGDVYKTLNSMVEASSSYKYKRDFWVLLCPTRWSIILDHEELDEGLEIWYNFNFVWIYLHIVQIHVWFHEKWNGRRYLFVHLHALVTKWRHYKLLYWVCGFEVCLHGMEGWGKHDGRIMHWG